MKKFGERNGQCNMIIRYNDLIDIEKQLSKNYCGKMPMTLYCDLHEALKIAYVYMKNNRKIACFINKKEFDFTLTEDNKYDIYVNGILKENDEDLGEFINWYEAYSYYNSKCMLVQDINNPKALHVIEQTY